MAFDGYTAFAFKIHVVKQLGLRLTLGNGIGIFKQTIGQGTFTMVDVGYDTEITYVLHFESAKIAFCTEILASENQFAILPQQMTNQLFSYIGQQHGFSIKNFSPVGGGSINRVYCLYSDSQKYLIKINDRNAFPGMFAAEAEGLNTIRRTRTIAVPEVVLQGDFEDESFLMLEWIENKRPTAKGSELLGKQLANMHQTTAGLFGSMADNYMGSLKQSNRSHPTWSNFFAEERLKPMINIALYNNLINNDDIDNFDYLYEHLPDLFEEENPSLIHGDLWSGNYLVSADDRPYLIDPAIAYGHREFDIAMTTLFGGFSSEFYEAYQYHFPLQNGWQHRIDLWNLYPLLVHLNLFGLSYLGQVRDCLKQYL